MSGRTKLRRWWLTRYGRRTGPGRRTGRLPLRLELLESRLTPSDGTGAGTKLVMDINPGSDTSYLRSLTDVNGTLFFTVNDSAHGVELWKSNGTAAGTVLVKDINPGAAGSYPQNLMNVNGALFFSALDDTHGIELWKSDGTAAGTVLVKDINPGTGNYGQPLGSFPGNLTNLNGTLFFSADDGTHGFGLWKSDGTTAGTALVKSVAVASPPMATVGGTLFFQGSDATSGTGLWKSDGTDAGTMLVKHVSANNLTNVNGTLFFAGDDGTTGTELWKSDGTTAGTVLVKDIYTGSTNVNDNGHYYGHYHRHYRFLNSSSPTELTNVNGTLYFTAYESKHGRELWKSDGSATGTVLVKDIEKGQSSSHPAGLTGVNGTLLFSANDGTTGYELWKSDGAATGTVLVKDINPGANANGFPRGSYLADLTNANGTLYFSANDGIRGGELWTSDGTAAGTVLVADVNPGGRGSYPSYLTLSGGHLFFAADDGAHGRELWDPPILPGPGADTAPSSAEIGNSGDIKPFGAWNGWSDAKTSVPSITGMRDGPPRQDVVNWLADDAARSAAGGLGNPAPTDLVFGEVVTQGNQARDALAFDLWSTELLPDSSLNGDFG